jgi:hypothetical protein
MEIPLPTRISPEHRAALLAAVAEHQAAASASYGYFYEEKLRIEAPFADCNDQLRAWKEHREGVLYTGSDARYNELKAAATDADQKRMQAAELLASQYPWLAKDAHSLAASGTDAAGRIIDSCFKEAQAAVLQERHKDEIESLRGGLSVPRILEPSEIPIGATVFADRGQCVFTVTRRTHNGKRTLALDSDGKEVRLMPGTGGDGYMTAARGFSIVTPEWARRKEALTKLWQAVVPPPVSEP